MISFWLKIIISFCVVIALNFILPSIPGTIISIIILAIAIIGNYFKKNNSKVISSYQQDMREY